MKYYKKIDLKITKRECIRPKMHKTPICETFIVASKNCSTKSLHDVISRVFKMIFNHVESFNRKSLSYTCLNKFLVVES